MSSQGTKVTSDSERFTNSTVEGAGTVINDSLAAESTHSGGVFSQNRDAEPIGTSARGTTTNNTDTSGATKLDPVQRGSLRTDDVDPSAQGSTGGVKYAEGFGGQQGGTVISNSAGTRGGSGTSGASAATGSIGQVDRAPSYIQAATNDPSSRSNPRGTNLSEGEFDDNGENNASFTTDIGSYNDPGRVAVNQFQRQANESGAGAAQARDYSAKFSGNQTYGNLDETSA